LSDGLKALLHFSDHDLSWLAQFFSLLVLPFAHEDLAIILGGYIVVNKIMPVGLVALCIYGGMVASDFALYGIGRGARRLPWLTRLAVDDRVRGFGDMIKRNLFGLVALCRVVPGIVFIAFVACGWMRVPLGRFTVASLLVSALYLPTIVPGYGPGHFCCASWWRSDSSVDRSLPSKSRLKRPVPAAIAACPRLPVSPAR
jgi:membrane protein DedA with SNARE-associated domain